MTPPPAARAPPLAKRGEGDEFVDDAFGAQMTLAPLAEWTRAQPQPGWFARLFDYKPVLILLCLFPAVGLLMVFLTYPLGLGIWLAFTDTKIGRSGQWVGLENFGYLLDDSQFWEA